MIMVKIESNKNDNDNWNNNNWNDNTSNNKNKKHKKTKVIKSISENLCSENAPVQQKYKCFSYWLLVIGLLLSPNGATVLNLRL